MKQLHVSNIKEIVMEIVFLICACISILSVALICMCAGRTSDGGFHGKILPEKAV